MICCLIVCNLLLPRWTLEIDQREMDQCLSKVRIPLEEENLIWSPLISSEPIYYEPDEVYNLLIDPQPCPDEDDGLNEGLSGACKKKRRRRWYKAYTQRRRKRKQIPAKSDTKNSIDAASDVGNVVLDSGVDFVDVPMLTDDEANEDSLTIDSPYLEESVKNPPTPAISSGSDHLSSTDKPMIDCDNISPKTNKIRKSPSNSTVFKLVNETVSKRSRSRKRSTNGKRVAEKDKIKSKLMNATEQASTEPQDCQDNSNRNSPINVDLPSCRSPDNIVSTNGLVSPRSRPSSSKSTNDHINKENGSKKDENVLSNGIEVNVDEPLAMKPKKDLISPRACTRSTTTLSPRPHKWTRTTNGAADERYTNGLRSTNTTIDAASPMMVDELHSKLELIGDDLVKGVHSPTPVLKAPVSNLLVANGESV